MKFRIIQKNKYLYLQRKYFGWWVGEYKMYLPNGIYTDENVSELKNIAKDYVKRIEFEG